MVLIDTPGFDDTYRTDGEVLQDVATCLELTYSHNMKLSGIIYLHRIIDPRITGSGLRNLKMFRKLCGNDPLKNVILVTSFWSQVNGSYGNTREEELKTTDEYWGDMIVKGSRMARFEDTHDSALNIIMSLVGKERIALDIQKEMVEQGKTLIDTTAGEALNEELAEMLKKHASDMEELRKDMEEAAAARDTELQLILEKEAKKAERRMEDMRMSQELLKEDKRNELRAIEQEFDRRLRIIEMAKTVSNSW